MRVYESWLANVEKAAAGEAMSHVIRKSDAPKEYWTNGHAQCLEVMTLEYLGSMRRQLDALDE